MAFLFAANPLIISWTVANTGGNTKKSAVLSVYNAFNATGSIIGPMRAYLIARLPWRYWYRSRPFARCGS